MACIAAAGVQNTLFENHLGNCGADVALEIVSQLVGENFAEKSLVNFQ
jgi:hypothetical protein